MKTSRIVLGCMLAAFCLLAGGAGAQVITEFSAGNGGQPTDITAGPDGNLWFTEHSIGNRIGRITPAGVVTEFIAGTGCQQGRYPAPLFPTGITAGPDGNLWFTETVCGRIGRMTPQGVVTEFSAGINAHPYGITAGPDGNLWFTESANRIGRITPAGVVTEFSAGITGIAGGITAGPDGNLWFTESVRSPPTAPTIGWIGRMTPDGVVTEFSAGITDGALATSITAGPDGNLWFTESVPSPFPASPVGRIGRITPAGVVTEFSAGITGFPLSITAGPDGNVWFTEGDRIGQITPAGVVTEFRTGIMYAHDITAGPEGNLWFTDSAYNRIGRITACLIEAACSPSTTTIVSSGNPSHVGQAIVFTASVAGNFATGTVQFLDGATALGSPITLSGGGVAQFMTSTLTRGTHAITAVYSGDDNNSASTSSVLLEKVKRGNH